MKTLSPTTMGLELPRPSSGAFHLMFSVLDQFSGALFSLDSPVPRGPRHWSQSEANDRRARRHETARRIAVRQSRDMAMVDWRGIRAQTMTYQVLSTKY